MFGRVRVKPEVGKSPDTLISKSENVDDAGSLPSTVTDVMSIIKLSSELMLSQDVGYSDLVQPNPSRALYFGRL
jgi:hypothetical protein